ncbi:MAG: biotin/lipoate A/B protein ligase family protein [Nitrospinota bacterium]
MIKARLILDPPRDGFWNMAADEALFDCLEGSGFPVTLRIYGWSRPTLSLGRRQKLSEPDVAECRGLGVDVVKRIGGGGAVFHGSEITYCFVSRIGPPGMPDVTDPRLWREIFVYFLESLGIAADDQDRQQDSRLCAASCFSTANGDEPTINGRKWIGSARRKSRKCFLQHGSILIEQQPDFLCKLMPGSGPNISTGLRKFVPSLSEHSATDALVIAVKKNLQLEFSAGDYTDAEHSSIKRLRALKTGELRPSPAARESESLPSRLHGS